MQGKTIFEMGIEEIIDKFLQERGLDIEDEKLRKQYDRELVRKAKAGDSCAMISLLKIGTHRRYSWIGRR